MYGRMCMNVCESVSERIIGPIYKYHVVHEIVIQFVNKNVSQSVSQVLLNPLVV